ncbi:uncharacterized protein LOC110250391 isoform X2 [Exaiptasia diaphana]|uniref:Uncharacterized protein n=1 Tax=Exaiptasia diaphana TaxID=2652724 RepID=A0A913YSB1_EXADI|nr:uncharacterized protein LOC110250391 isoform X2 [Exaiptasia diaphana]
MEKVRVNVFFIWFLSGICFALEIALVHPSSPISLDDFTPFGEDNGDVLMPSQLDAISDKINIRTAFPLFGRKFTSLYVSSHGLISFEKVFASYKPKRFSPLVGNFTIIAPFWADVARRYIGGIFYRQNNSQYLLEVASIDVRKAFPEFSRFSAIWMFVATWKNVTFYGSHNNYMTKNITNTFQSVLLTDGRYSFVRFNYHKITWTTGTTSGGNPKNGLGGTEAGCGFNAGFGNHSYNVAFNGYRNISVLDLPFKTNVNKSGVWMFRTDGITIQEAKGKVEDKPRNVTVSPSHLVLNETETLTLTCDASTNPAGNYSWSLNGKILEGKTNRVLTKDNITAQDAGEYICTVTHTFGADTSNKAVIYIRYIGNAVCSAPASANEGDLMVLNCSAKGYPPVSYTWTTPDKVHQRPIASIPATADLNGVTVTCKATNKIENSTCTRSLTVYYKPYNIQVSPTSVVLNEKESINITCSASANPPGEYSWSFNGNVLDGETDKVLAKRDITRDEAGEYRCMATNSVGSGASNTSVVKVLFAPFTFSATFRLTSREYQQEFNDKNSPSFNKLKDEIEKEVFIYFFCAACPLQTRIIGWGVSISPWAKPRLVTT